MTKTKLLDYTLIGILAGIPQAAPAQETTPSPAAAPAADPSLRCGANGCDSEQGVLMSVRTRGEREPVDADAPATSRALQPDRRVDVQTEQPGKAVAIGKWSVQLPDGGVIWATEDPTLGQPQFNVSAPSLVAFDGRRIAKPVRFYAYSNYPGFQKRVEILIYRGSDTDLVSPIATVELPTGAVSEATWDGSLPAGIEVRQGDSLAYIARIHGEDGSFDETYPREMQLVSPEDEKRGVQQLQRTIDKQYGTAFTEDEAQAQSLIQDTFGQNALRLQNIPIHGSRIRIQGRDIPDNYSVTINGQSQPVDLQRKLVAEYLEPIGEHAYDIRLAGPDRQVIEHTLDVDVSGRYMFAVALADVTASHDSASGSVEAVTGDGNFDKNLLVDGRLAFYLKGKIKGKYLVTAQADTQEREVEQLFTGFWKADPQDIFRQLDPDDYYPAYGDDSTTYRDVDTQGKLYVRVDWDKSQALWGNFYTGFTGTQYAQYVRSLYGGAIDWRSRGSTVLGEPRAEIHAFGSQAQTVPGHSEFVGTGGSLYYLKHTDVLPGSDQVVLEVRDSTTGRVQSRVPLARGADYEIDNIQGRLLLTRPLAQVTRENLPTLTHDAPLDGYTQFLMVDYEFVPTGFEADDFTAGFRGKYWFGDHVAVGGTWVDENREGEDYSLRGADLTLQAGRGTYLKVEQSHSESQAAPVFFSTDGGLSFEQLGSGLGAGSGDATSVEARANFKELGWTKLDWSAGAWSRRVDAGYSIARADIGQDIRENGFEVMGQFAPNVNVYARWSRAEQGEQALEQGQATAEWRVNDDITLSGELRRVQEQRSTGTGTGTLGAFEYRQRFGGVLDVYGIAQVTLDDDDGRYADNNAFTAGAKYQFGNLSSLGAELTTGDRGDAATVNAEYRITPQHAFYGNYTYSTDTADFGPLFNNGVQPGWTLGQRWQLSNQVNVYNESQFLKAPDQSGLAHTFGMDFYPAQGWNLGFTLQDANLDSDIGNVDRKAISLSGGHNANRTQWQSKLEWRKDSGAAQREQWVTTNNLVHKLGESLRIAARLNYSKTTDELDPSAGAKFIESNMGFAWRPIDDTRWALLGKYTYLYDVSSLAQVGDSVADYDQRSQVLSFEGVYRPDLRWEFAGKAMRREGEVRMGRLEGEWADSAATFLAGQARYEFGGVWHALAEYRWLGVERGGDKRGFLVGVDRDVGRNFRIGAGYNFTDFSDDLTNFDYDHRGWFLNLVGSY